MALGSVFSFKWGLNWDSNAEIVPRLLAVGG